MKSAPLLVSFDSFADFLSCRSPFNAGTEVPLLTSLYQRGLPPIASVADLAVLFGYSPSFVQSIRKRSRRHYRVFTISKGNKNRTICSPRVGLKSIQSWLGYHLARSINYLDSVHGFVPNRSTLTAAKVHCGSTWLITIDVKDFFSSTRTEHVVNGLRSLDYSDSAARLIAEICALDNGLPQGSPASPVLANLAFRPIDLLINEECKKLSVRFTRYADDLAFSGTGEIPEDLLAFTERSLKSMDWEIAPKKTRISQTPNSLKLLGVIVGNDGIRLPKTYRRRLRAFEHVVRTKNESDISDLHRLNGHLAYAASVINFDTTSPS